MDIDDFMAHGFDSDVSLGEDEPGDVNENKEETQHCDR